MSYRGRRRVTARNQRKLAFLVTNSGVRVPSGCKFNRLSPATASPASEVGSRLLNDPAIVKAIQEGDYMSLLGNAKIQALESNEHLKQLLQQQGH